MQPGTSDVSLSAWNVFLDETEADLNASEEAVRSGSDSLVPEWLPPADLGTMPVELRERVSSLMGRIDLLSTFVKYQLAALEADIEHVHRKGQQKGTHSKATALFLDASA